MSVQFHDSQSLRPKEAANLLGIGVSTFWRWTKERPDMPVGRKLSARVTVFERAKLLAWRDAQASANSTNQNAA